MLRLIALLILGSLSLTVGGVISIAAPLAASDESRQLGGAELAFLRDPDGRYEIAGVKALADSDAFQPLIRGLVFGYTRDVIWLRITLQRASDAPSAWRLEVSNPNINDLQFYSPDKEGCRVAQAGDRFPFSARQFPYHNPIFGVDLPDSAPHTFYLRIQTDSSTSAGLSLWQPAALRDSAQVLLLLFGGVMGMLLMSLMFSMFNWAFTRSRQVLSFAVMTAALIVMIPAQLGLLGQFVFPRAPLWADLAVPWSLAFTIVAVMLIFRRPLEIPQNHPRLDLVLRASMVLTLLAPTTREFDLYWRIGGPVLQAMFSLALLVNAWVAWRRWCQNHNGAVYLFVAHVLLFVSMLLGRLVWLGLLAPAPWLTLSWVPGVLVFLTLAQLGIMLDARTTSRARFAAEHEARAARKQSEQERQLREEQTVFFSFVAHELRSPLGVIVVGLKNLGRQLQRSEPATQHSLERIDRAAQRMARMVDRHLDLQRLANADFQPRMMLVAPLEQAVESIRQAREIHSQRRFVLTEAGNLPNRAFLDTELVIVALTNLLTNAAKYSPRDEPVFLDVSADTMLRYRIIDRGPGIPLEQHQRLFQIFHRANDAPRNEGFGIGLAIAWRVAKIHGGLLEYADHADGGAVFVFSLPLKLSA